MNKNQKLGSIGEDVAKCYLEANGYCIMDMNWRIGHWELDLVCNKDDLIIIVEVKTRTNIYEYPHEILSKSKIRNLIKAGEEYVKLNSINKEIRFDLIIIDAKDMRVKHYEDAIQIYDN